MKTSLRSYLSIAFLWLVLSSSAQAQLFYRTIATGDWATNTTWESASDVAFSTGLVSPAAASPTSTAGAISIRHAVTVSTTITVDQVTVTTGGSVTISASGIMNVADGTGDDLILARPSATNLIIDGGQIVCATSAVLTSNGFTGITVEINNGGSITMGNSGYLNTHIDTQYTSTGGGAIAFGSASYAAIRNASGVMGHFASGINFTFTASSTSGFEFTGSTPINTGFPAAMVSVPYMLITNTSSVTLNQSMTISHRLSMINAGSLVVNTPYELTLTGLSNSLSNATAIITGTGTTTIASGAVIASIGNLNGLTASSASGAIQTATRNYSSGARYAFNGGGAQATGDFFNATTPTANSVAGLNINNASGVSLSANATVTNVSAATSLVLTAGALILNGNTLTIFNISGSGSGTITGSSTSNFVFNGTVAMGRGIPFTAGGRTLNNYTGRGSLASDLAIMGTYTATSQALTVISPNTLTINGNITFPTGSVALSGAGNLILSNGANFSTTNASGVSGSVTLSGTITWNAGASYTFNGTVAQNTGFPATLTTLENLTINNTGGDVTLNRSITANGVLSVLNNDLNLNGFNVALSASGFVVETLPNHLIKDNTATDRTNTGGYIQVTNFPTFDDAGYSDISGTGLEIRGTGTVITNVRRYHFAGTHGGGSSFSKGIKRVYAITGTAAVGVTDIRFSYASSELNGISDAVASNMYMSRWRSSDNWKSFQHGTNGVTFTSGLIEMQNIDGFSHWTMSGSPAPLPITLLGLKGVRVEGLRGEMTEEVRLEWSTASEINNKGFEVEMSENGRDYTKIAFVEGKGNSTTTQSYNHTTIQPQDAYYRLKQVDFDGTFSYSPVVFVEGLVGKVVVYPNPSNGAFNISVGKDKLDSPARLLNAQGVEVWKGMQTEVRATNLPAGIYFLHTTVAGKTNITKIVIM